jgi:cytochrome b involved in lipid metabolism
MAINGKVYNVTAYLPFHPGGEKEMMRGVGRDGTKLFSKTSLKEWS